jgi:HEAT repeat protein
VKAAAASALGNIGDTRAVDALILALDDPEVHSDAAFSLSKIGDERALAPLMKYQGQDERGNPNSAADAIQWITDSKNREKN